MADSSEHGPGLMERVKKTLSYYHYADRTRLSYERWIKAYVRFLGKKKVPPDQSPEQIDTFLDFLETERHLSESSRKQAFNAINFLFKRVFDLQLDTQAAPVKKRKTVTLPVIMTRQETASVLSFMKGKHLLMASLMYGAGLRLMECVRLRVQQLNFKRNIIVIRTVNANRGRVVMIPARIRQALLKQVETVKDIYQKDLLSVTQDGRMEKAFTEQYVFPGKNRITGISAGLVYRSHVMESGLQKAVKTAVRRSGIKKRVSCSTFRHSFAVHLLQDNVSINMIKDLMGHMDIRTTQVYLKALPKRDFTKISPLDRL